MKGTLSFFLSLSHIHTYKRTEKKRERETLKESSKVALFIGHEIISVPVQRWCMQGGKKSYFFLLYLSTFSPFSTSIRSQALTWVACWRKCRSWSSNSELHLLIKASSWAYDITGAVLTRDNTRISFCNLTEGNISHVKSFVPGCDNWSRGGSGGGWCSRCCSLQPQRKTSSNSSASSSYTTHTHTQLIQITEENRYNETS